MAKRRGRSRGTSSNISGLGKSVSQATISGFPRFQIPKLEDIGKDEDVTEVPRAGLTPSALQIADVRRIPNDVITSPPLRGKLNPTASQPVAEFASLDLTKHLTPVEWQEQMQ